jgi:octaprenyl-diphosphate synthase
VGLNHTFMDNFNSYFQRIEEELHRCFQTQIPIIDEIGKHSLFGNGKRLRPLLFVLSCELCGYFGEDIYRLSTIFEFLHTASLLHDDVIDNAELRRNKPSANHVWGNSAAVLTGDYLASLCSAIAIDTNNFEFMKVLIDTGTRMSEGQALELVHTRDWNMRKEHYMEIITSKTASLMSAACAGAGTIAHIENEKREDLGLFGLNLGIAFQLIDDLLDYTSSEDTFGKPVGKDLKEGKITLPFIYAFSDFNKAERKKFENLRKDNSIGDEEYNKLLLDIRNSKAIAKVKSDAVVFANKAATNLDAFNESPVRENLLALNTYLVNRSY